MDRVLGDDNLETLQRKLANMQKDYEWLLRTLNINEVVDLENLNLFDISVINNKIAQGVDGAKLLALSVLDGAIEGLNGGKLDALSTPWDALINTRQNGSFSVTVPAGAEIASSIQSTAIAYRFAGPPFIRPSGYSTQEYVYPVAGTYFSYLYNAKIYAKCSYYTDKNFVIIVGNSDIVSHSITFNWYRDGFYIPA